MKTHRTNLILIFIGACLIASNAYACNKGKHFYDHPPYFEPGQIIRVQRNVRMDPALFDNIRGTRVMYVTQDHNDEEVFATGIYFKPRRGHGGPGYGGQHFESVPLLVWAHGTTGLGENAAPSRSSALYLEDDASYNWQRPNFAIAVKAQLDAGFAVFAPDYIGLGIDTGSDEVDHTYLAKQPMVNAILHGVMAVTYIDPFLTKQFGVFGHSQGANAANAVAETIIPPEYGIECVGVAASSGVFGLEQVAFALVADPSLGGYPYGGYIFQAVEAFDPNFDGSTYIGPFWQQTIQVPELGERTYYEMAETLSFQDWFTLNYTGAVLDAYGQVRLINPNHTPPVFLEDLVDPSLFEFSGGVFVGIADPFLENYIAQSELTPVHQVPSLHVWSAVDPLGAGNLTFVDLLDTNSPALFDFHIYPEADGVEHSEVISHPYTSELFTEFFNAQFSSGAPE